MDDAQLIATDHLSVLIVVKNTSQTWEVPVPDFPIDAL
jgi:hypothetical protein